MISAGIFTPLSMLMFKSQSQWGRHVSAFCLEKTSANSWYTLGTLFRSELNFSLSEGSGSRGTWARIKKHWAPSDCIDLLKASTNTRLIRGTGLASWLVVSEIFGVGSEVRILLETGTDLIVRFDINLEVGFGNNIRIRIRYILWKFERSVIIGW
jgi:hypothetical protein